MSDLFSPTGAHVLVDGQFGSTGKGVLAAWLAAKAIEQGAEFDMVISNAGPNSGHTFYHGDEKHVLKQLPTFAVASHLLGCTIPIFLSAGAVIDPEILYAEVQRYPGIPVYVHPNAAVITEADKETEKGGTIAAVAGTRSGTGAALARKVARDPSVTFEAWVNETYTHPERNFIRIVRPKFRWGERYFVEVSQGFSLGINQGFYPKCTSRECTVSQALADAGMPPRMLAKTYMSMRTFPIRVGNVDGHSSGDWYPDQTETTWEELGVEPELTTVTQRVRRVATFSDMQFLDAVRANDPDFVFVNFMNYLSPKTGYEFILRMARLQESVNRPMEFIWGHGAKSEDVYE